LIFYRTLSPGPDAILSDRNLNAEFWREKSYALTSPDLQPDLHWTVPHLEKRGIKTWFDHAAGGKSSNTLRLSSSP
jgi:hypothetical protein